MQMTIHRREDDITLVVLTGRLDSTGVEEISESFTEALGAATQSTILDFAQIDFLGSRGLGLLIGQGKKLIKNGHKLILLNPSEMVESVVVATKLDQLLPISHDLDEAIRELGGVPSTASSDGTTTAAAASAVVTAEAESDRPPAECGPTAAVVTNGELKLAIENDLSELKALNHTLAEFLREHGVASRATYAVNVAIDELVNNIIRYAYVDDDTHLIDIELAIAGEQIILRIADDGRPFDPRKGPGLDLHCEDRDVAELGMVLILEMVDKLKYRRVDDKNRVEVRIHLFVEDEQGDPTSTPGGPSDVRKAT